MKKNLLEQKAKFALLFAIASIVGFQACEASYKMYCPDPRPPAEPFTQVQRPDGVYVISAKTHGGTPMEVFLYSYTQIADLSQAQLTHASLEDGRGGKLFSCHYTATNGTTFRLNSIDPVILDKCNQSPALNATYIECSDEGLKSKN